MSQATVTTSSWLTPESGTIETRGSPRLFAIPPTVRRYWLPLKTSAASTIASSSSESRRRIGSETTGSSRARAAAAEQRAEAAAPAALAGNGRRRRAALLEPAVLERDVDAERADVDVTPSPPSGANRVARSPISSVRSQIAQARAWA